MSDKTISPQMSAEPAVAGGAGFGNKTSEGHGKADSTLGKVLEKVGNTIHSSGMASHGSERRASAGYAAEEPAAAEPPK